MTIRHIAAGAELTRPLTDIEFQTLHKLGLIAPCHGCTRLLNDDGEPHPLGDEVVYHPRSCDAATMSAVTSVLDPKKRH